MSDYAYARIDCMTSKIEQLKLAHDELVKEEDKISRNADISVSDRILRLHAVYKHYTETVEKVLSIVKEKRKLM